MHLATFKIDWIYKRGMLIRILNYIYLEYGLQNLNTYWLDGESFVYFSCNKDIFKISIKLEV